MKLVFENIDKQLNFVDCLDVNKSTMPRFSSAPILNHWRPEIKKQLDDNDEKYIIASGVNHCPEDWTGFKPYSRVKSIFKYLSPKYLNDLRTNKAMLLLDQSLEGYHQTWIFEYFHVECKNYQIDPNNIIYITGNSNVEQDYKLWLDSNPQESLLNVFEYIHFEEDMYELTKRLVKDTSFKTNIKYKRTNDISLFNCLNKRNRNHRAWFYTKLYQNNLLDDGLISMNSFNTSHHMDGLSLTPDTIEEVNKTLPRWIDEPNNIEDDGFYIRRVRNDVCLNSYVSVISEAHFADSSNTLFISEKTFKVIACRHPFIILGNRGSLAKLRELGYKTFEGFIDESYDDLPTHERMDAIINSLQKLKREKNLGKWYKKLQPILNYNYNRLKNRSLKKNETVIKIENLYKQKFGEGNV